MNNRDNNNGGLFMFLAGVAAGIVGAMYYSDNKKDINGTINDNVDKFSHHAKKNLHNVRNHTTDFLNTAGDKLNDFGNKLSDIANKKANDLDDKLDSAREFTKKESNKIS